jgi:pantoate--beta-alanine ligase
MNKWVNSRMQVVKQIEELRQVIGGVKREGRVVGLVPTMGALHDGHMALVNSSRENGDFTVVSIFVNPTQFGPSEDFERYPRQLEADLEKCRAAGVELVFAPDVSEMYPEGFGTYVDVQGITEILEGASRPGHFRGVATIVIKLFAAVEPRRAYFGMKDYQQLKVIEKMVRDLNVRVDIIPVPIVREPDGLAMSSRNVYLSKDERRAAASLYKALMAARNAAGDGVTDAESIRQIVESILLAEPLVQIDYVAVVDKETLLPIDSISKGAVVLLAVRIGSTRLIDNMLIGVSDK